MASAEAVDHYPETAFQEADVFDAADIISTVEFDHTGNYLATGDKGGRVVLFERNETVSFKLFLRLRSFELIHVPRKKPANTNSTPNSNHMSLNLTTSNP